MAQPPMDPRWPKVLSLSVHEFRTPMTVVSGYIRMLLKDRAGAVTDQQRRLLQEAEKSCARLSALLAEVSELSNLEAGTLPFNKSRADLHQVLRDAVAQLPPLPDREVGVSLDVDPAEAPIDADPVRLGQALGAVIAAMRRELVGEEGLVVRARRTSEEYEILLGDPATIEAFATEAQGDRAIFDEWRGGVGLSLVVARRILNAHDGAIFSAPGGHKAGARILLRPA
jgi:K+-sensing histidine kinase KdpD